MENRKRGRIPVIPREFYGYDFAKEAKKEHDARVRVKLLALEQIKNGKGYKETGVIFGFNGAAIKTWTLQVAQEGLARLKLKMGRGRKSKLANYDIEKFKEAIMDLQEKKSGGRINVADITKMANEKFGTTYKIKGMYGLLHKIGMVWISARSKHTAHNQAAQDTLKKTL